MRNWNIDTSQMDKSSQEYQKWHLVQLINFGLNGEKISRNDARRYINEIDVDSDKKRFIQFLLENA